MSIVDREKLDAVEEVLTRLDDSVFAEVLMRQAASREAFAPLIVHLESLSAAAVAPAGHPLRILVDPAARSRREVVRKAAQLSGQGVRVVSTVEAGRILADRGVLDSRNHSDSLRKWAKSGKLLGLYENGRWSYPRFQLDYFDPRDEANIIARVNMLLDAGQFPGPAMSWWTTPSRALPGRARPSELLTGQQEDLLALAEAYAAGPDL